MGFEDRLPTSQSACLASTRHPLARLPRTSWPLTRTCDDSLAVLERLEVGGVVDHVLGIEDRDVGDTGRAGAGRGRCRPILAALSDVILRTASSSRNSWRFRTYSPRTRGNVPKLRGWGWPRRSGPFDRQGRAVGADRAPGLDQGEVHVLFGVMGVDRADRAVLLDQEIEEHVERVGRRAERQPSSPR